MSITINPEGRITGKLSIRSKSSRYRIGRFRNDEASPEIHVDRPNNPRLLGLTHGVLNDSHYSYHNDHRLNSPHISITHPMNLGTIRMTISVNRGGNQRQSGHYTNRSSSTPRQVSRNSTHTSISVSRKISHLRLNIYSHHSRSEIGIQPHGRHSRIIRRDTGRFESQ